LQEAVRAFSQVYALIEQNAADTINPNSLVYEAALPALLRRLDPHSVFFSPAQFEQLKEMQKSTAKGFGTVVSVLPGRVIVLQTVPGAPSVRAGIAPGDEIVGINNINLGALDMDQLVGLLSETRQRQALLHVRRPGNAKLMNFTLVPEELASPSVDRAWHPRAGIGYVRATSFEADTGKLMAETIEKLGGKDLKGLVLDLRNNGGGIIHPSLEVAALFLPGGKKLVTLRGRARDLDEPKVPEGTKPYSFPVVVLINEKTASAAEIVAGALQDYDRATIVGLPSFGKGLVQSVFPMSQGTGMALTTAFYFTPSGRSIQKPLKEGQLEGNTRYANLETTTDFRTSSGRKVRGGGGIEPDFVVWPERQTRLRAFLDASASLTAFATEYLQKHTQVSAQFRVMNSLLDELQVYLSTRNVRPSLSEWSADREWIRSRVLQEIFNQSLGVEKGDEVESQRDPQVQRAVELLTVAQ